MGIDEDIRAFERKLTAAIDGAMQNEVCDGAKAAAQQSAHENVYDAYTPEMLSRRMSDGGIADTGNMEASYANFTLTITNNAPWQQLWGGAVPPGKLSEAVASGDPRYHMELAGARPFMQAAEDDFAKAEFENSLRAGLKARGIG